MHFYAVNDAGMHPAKCMSFSYAFFPSPCQQARLKKVLHLHDQRIKSLLTSDVD